MKTIKVRLQQEPLRHALVPLKQIRYVYDQGNIRVIHIKGDKYIQSDESLESIETKMKNP